MTFHRLYSLILGIFLYWSINALSEVKGEHYVGGGGGVGVY